MTRTPTSGPRQRLARASLLAAVFVCAACGLVYELALVTLGSYLIGNTARQASIVLGIMVFAMGVGALAAKPLQRRAVGTFAVIELLLALFGGLSVMALYAAFAWLSLYTFAMVVVAVIVGILIGAEIPLLMVMLQRIRKQSAGSAVADLFAADYVGALIGGLVFPFLLLPVFGQIRGALIVGAVNAIAGVAVVFGLFRKQMRRRTKWILAVISGAVSLILIGGYVYSDRFEVAAQQALFSQPIVYSQQTQYQQIVLTESVSPFASNDLRLYLNGDLQFAEHDEYRYHESLVHPVMAPHPKDVLILGGGDGLALREVLKYDDVENVTLVELDPAMTELGSTDSRLTALNKDAFEDPRVNVVNADAFSWLRGNKEKYESIIVDMPDPDETATAKLYTVEFYGIVASTLSTDGVMVVQAGSPYFAPKSFWSIGKSIAKADLESVPYHVTVPSFGADWGYHLAAKESAPKLWMDPPEKLQFLNDETLANSTVFPEDRKPMDVKVSTLMHPVILDYAQSEWDVG
ncbi:MAG TPA: polyamine aminopropyltransferase [Candidatus Stackebrandtia faecavium]|nr:polyamine aminopropyltransferase [Candidatus Stackebrandtia faecavium]